jgi:rubrerythrin
MSRLGRMNAASYAGMGSLARNLAEYIQDEMSDCMYYMELADRAPTARSKDLLMQFSRDEMMHAERFMEAYRRITGKEYVPTQESPPMVPANYMEALNQRILAETADYQKYGEQYLSATDRYFRNLFFETRTSEAQHAMRIQILVNDTMPKHERGPLREPEKYESKVVYEHPDSQDSDQEHPPAKTVSVWSLPGPEK